MTRRPVHAARASLHSDSALSADKRAPSSEVVLVKRYRQAYLSNVRIDVRVAHRERIPVRGNARILGDTNIIADSENRADARLSVAVARNAEASGAYAKTARHEKAAG